MRIPKIVLFLSPILILSGCQKDNYLDDLTNNLPQNKQIEFAQLIMDRGEPSVIFRFSNDKEVYGVSAFYITTLCSKDTSKPTFVELPASRVIWQNDKIWLRYATFDLPSTDELHRWQDVLHKGKIGTVLYNECHNGNCS